MRRIVLESAGGVRLDVEVAESRRERMRGLLRRERLSPGHALLIPNTRSVHTLGMRFSIEAIFLDRDLNVVGKRQLAPGRICWPRPRARHILECNPGEGPARGDRLTALYTRPCPRGVERGAPPSAPIV